MLLDLFLQLFLEIYGMTAQREVLPHDIKYHITKKTPKGKKRQQPLPSPGIFS